MKKSVLFIVCLFLASFLHAQDIIVKKNGDEISAKIIEVGLIDIKYKNFNHLDGPVHIMLKGEVFMIKYENGTKEVFSMDRPSNVSNNDNQPAKSENPEKVQVIIYRKNSPSGFAVVYDLYANDKYVTKIANNTYFATQFDEGLVYFTAQTEQKISASMNLEPGKTYYLRCGVSSGVWVGIPKLEFVPENIGVNETLKMKK